MIDHLKIGNYTLSQYEKLSWSKADTFLKKTSVFLNRVFYFFKSGTYLTNKKLSIELERSLPQLSLSDDKESLIRRVNNLFLRLLFSQPKNTPAKEAQTKWEKRIATTDHPKNKDKIEKINKAFLETNPVIRHAAPGAPIAETSQAALNTFAPSVTSPPVGIPNVGNSCYMNACLQNFFAHPALLEKLLTNDFSKEAIGRAPRFQNDLRSVERDAGQEAAQRRISAISELSEAIMALYHELIVPGQTREILEERANAVRVAIFKSGLNIDLSNMADISRQQDADALISVLFDLIGQGISLETTRLSPRGDVSLAPKTAFNASLSLPITGSAPDLQQLVTSELNGQKTDPLNKIRFSVTAAQAKRYVDSGAKALEASSLTSANKDREINGTRANPILTPVVVNEGGGSWSVYLPTVKEQTKIQQPPKVLAIQLKRFSFDPLTGRASRNTSPVTIKDDSLDLSAFVQGGKRAKYRLTGMVHHLGGESINGGHYVSSVKKGDTWHHCNDSTITEKERDQPKDAYLLFFTLQD